MADPAVGYDGNPLTSNNGGTDNSAFLKQLAAALASVGGAIGGKALANGQGNPLTSAVPPELSSMLAQANQRQAYQNPLFQATTQGAYDMLPDFAKTGTSLSGTLSNTVPQGSGGGGISGTGLAAAGGFEGIAALLAKLASGGGGGGDLKKAFDDIKKKFGGGGNAAGGNAPISNAPSGDGSAGYYDPEAGWSQGNNNPTPETSGRAFGPDGKPLPYGGSDQQPVDWSWLFGGGGGDQGNGKDLR